MGTIGRKKKGEREEGTERRPASFCQPQAIRRKERKGAQRDHSSLPAAPQALRRRGEEKESARATTASQANFDRRERGAGRAFLEREREEGRAVGDRMRERWG